MKMFLLRKYRGEDIQKLAFCDIGAYIFRLSVGDLLRSGWQKTCKCYGVIKRSKHLKL